MYNSENINCIRNYFIATKQTIAVAESVTSGHLQAALSTATDASKFFQGGIKAYNIGQKCRQLMIEPTHALDCNSVSEKVAEQMALNVTKIFLSNYGIGVTGYAAPLPECNIYHPYMIFSIACENDVIITKQYISQKKEGVDVQLDYTETILDVLKSLLQ